MPLASQPSCELPEHLKQHGAQAGWMVLVGPLPFGEELAWIQVAAAADRPVLVVLPGFEPQQGEELQQLLQEHGVVGVSLCFELLGAEAAEVCWYRYNDSRQNGTTPPELLQPIWPNLRLDSSELRPQITLAQVLNQWFAAQSQPPGADGMLWLQASSAAEVLAGVGAWVASFATVLVAGALESDALTAQLEPVCFRAAVAGPQLQRWQRDPLLVLQSEHKQLREQVQALEVDRDALAAERDGVMAEREGLREQVQTLEDRMALINSELDEILALIDRGTTENLDSDSAS